MAIEVLLAVTAIAVTTVDNLRVLGLAGKLRGLAGKLRVNDDFSLSAQRTDKKTISTTR